MPEYLAPGVYVEETSFRSKSIEGVSTTTTGFVGPARFGPIDLEPEILTSLTEFERMYGDRQGLAFSGGMNQPNFVWHAVRSFFEEGGKRLYVARVFRQLGTNPDSYQRPSADIDDDDLAATTDLFNDGHARAWLTADPGNGTRDNSILVRARFPGALGNWRVRFTVALGQNMLSGTRGSLGSGSLRERDTVWIGDLTSPPSSPPAGTLGAGSFYVAQYDTVEETWIFNGGGAKTNSDFRLNVPAGPPSFPSLDPAEGHQLRLVSLTVEVSSTTGDTIPMVWTGIAPDPGHRNSFGAPDSLTSWFQQNPNSLAQARSLPIVIIGGSSIDSGREVIDALVAYGTRTTTNANLNQRIIDFSSQDPEIADLSTDSARSIVLNQSGGNDGAAPSVGDYQGTTNAVTND